VAARLEEHQFIPCCRSPLNRPLRYRLTFFFQRKDVLRALHAEEKSENWVECLGRVGSELRDYLSTSAVTLLPGLLEKIPILLFAGDQDFICNYMGIESMIKSLTWNGETGLGVGISPWWGLRH
jgi:carboxypeptidase D